MTALYPLRFRPVLQSAPWGGRRLGTTLGKQLPAEGLWAESWEISDHPAGQSVVEFGPLAGMTLGQLVAERGPELLGRHAPQPRFPLLMKFLDAAQTCSVQVHPDDARAARLEAPDMGKSEAWLVIEAQPGSAIYAGIKPGIGQKELTAALREGRCAECVHELRPSAGDCVFLPAGTIHALGSGLLVAEIQQASNVTYRLYDWDRMGLDGRPRPMHVEEGLEAIDFGRGPVAPQQPQPTDRPWVSRLVECDKFIWDRWDFTQPATAGGDDRFHLISVLEGAVHISGDPAGQPLTCGETVLLTASAGGVVLGPQGRTVLVDAYLP